MTPRHIAGSVLLALHVTGRDVSGLIQQLLLLWKTSLKPHDF